MTTMKEVAERTGVSVSTVSLVLNDRDEGRVKPAIAEQVRATAKRLGYRPNPLARSLRTSKTRILGFISEGIAAMPYAGGIILGAQDAASKLGYMLLTVNTDGNSDEAREIATLKRYGVDGFLYAKMSNRFTDVPKPLHDYPLVLVDATDRTGRYASIEPDETLIGYDATKRLIDACCASIAYIGCSEPMLAQQGRLEGYLFKDAVKNQVYVTKKPQPGAKTAVTEYRTLCSARGLSLVECRLLTGRTHQLRVHAAHPSGLNAPIAGDRLYGTAGRRLLLHAERIEFRHPATGDRIAIEKPADF